MKKIFVLSLVVIICLGGCAHRLDIGNQDQIATMSQQAQDTLKSKKFFTFPIISVSDKLKLKVREQWDGYERWMLVDMHKRFQFTTRDTIIAKVKVVIIQPLNVKSNKDLIGFHVHGGGFMMGTPYERAGMSMANEYGYRIYSVDYSLSPEVKYPVAINECLAVYKELSREFPNKKIVSSTISAGGQILQSMLLKAQSEHVKMPNVNVLYSPLLDLQYIGDSYYNNDGRDVIAAKNSSDKVFKNLYLTANVDLKDPMVSPVYGVYKADFPPTIIATGTRDLFLSPSLRGFWKLKEGNIETELLVGEGGWHTYQYYPDIPESIAARKAIYKFMDKHLNKN